MIDIVGIEDEVGVEEEILPVDPLERVRAIGEVFDLGAGHVGRIPFAPRRLLPGESLNDADGPVGPHIDLALDDDKRVEDAFDLAGETRAMITTDAGIAQLGTTPMGAVTAFRADAVLEANDRRVLFIARPGMIHATEKNAPQLLHKIGADLGDPDHYVHVDETTGEPIRLKGGHVTPHQIADRFRNYLESQLQLFSTEKIKGGIVVVDGALTSDTWDRPPDLVKAIANAAHKHGNHLVGVAKHSNVTVNGREIRYALLEAPPGPRWRDITADLNAEEQRLRDQGTRVRKRSVPGLHTFAARFSYVGATYRVDVLAAPGYEAREALASFFASTLMKAGYPSALIRAHLHCYFTWPDLIALQAAAAHQFGFVLQPQINLTPAFQPFGGRWK